MGTTRNTLREWFLAGESEGMTHMIVACDTFSFEDYPVYVKASEDVRQKAIDLIESPMTRVMEIYSMKIDRETQLNEFRACHLE